MDTKPVKTVPMELTEDELRAIVRMRNKRTMSYNLRVSEAESKFMNAIQEEVEKAGSKFESRTDFVIHCVKTVAAISKSQTKLL